MICIRLNTASNAPNHDMLKHDLQNLKATLKKKIRCAKAKYYDDIFDKNKSNIHHTLAAIKEILGKFKNKHEFPDYFTLDGKMISDSLSIANCFNIFFSKVGLKLAENIIYNGTKSVSSYLKHHVTSCFHFECVTPAIVNKYISELAAKKQLWAWQHILNLTEALGHSCSFSTNCHD